MKIYTYQDYQDYVSAQTEANRAKLDLVYVRKATIKAIVKRRPQCQSVLCHGTRNGAEQRMFLELLPGARVLGTEISDTADQFEHTVQWDFQVPRPEWVGAWDIVYSNSFDHSQDPVRALETWRDQLSAQGDLFLEHSPHGRSRRWDPLEITAEELLSLFQDLGMEVIHSWPGRSVRETDTHIYQVRRTAT